MGLIADGENAKKYFHSVPRAMLSFFQLVTVEGWPDIYEAATEDYPWFGGVIIFFIFFTNMLLLNLIVGVIVENTQVNFDCTILRWCSAPDLMALFDLLSTLDCDGRV